MTPKDRARELARKLKLTSTQEQVIRWAIRDAINEELSRMAPPKAAVLREVLWLGAEEINRGIG